ncbi:hypothetical protein C8035_v004541 [Colletotrichum spinosum]|uniref:Uncharacterized protein n=1 Tax=Colletotrichum spinosum TaxID=1347390 RepID=A0A4R8PTQ4_9PEZI|nr:hypothetical protein C8035_v004541 [Colletotrichum spinosum]
MDHMDDHMDCDPSSGGKDDAVVVEQLSHEMSDKIDEAVEKLKSELNHQETNQALLEFDVAQMKTQLKGIEAQAKFADAETAYRKYIDRLEKANEEALAKGFAQIKKELQEDIQEELAGMRKQLETERKMREQWQAELEAKLGMRG